MSPVQSDHFFLVSLFGLESIDVHPVGTERQVDGRRRQRSSHHCCVCLGAGHRGTGADVVARRRPEEVDCHTDHTDFRVASAIAVATIDVFTR